jgi:pimeloyl-ACP methyl ester carboxylesterase
MSYVTNPKDGVRIYYEVIGAGPPLVMASGFTMSTADWHDLGYVEALKDDHQLILIDPRGHGQSDGPYDAESYAMGLKVDDTLAVLDNLGIDRTHYLGFSMGGWLGFGMLRFASDRLMTMQISGMAPYDRDPARLEPMVKALAGGLENYIVDIERRNGFPMPEPRRTRYAAQDAEALIASLRGTWADSGLDSSLEKIDTPCLMWIGTDDPNFERAKLAAGVIPNVEFHVLNGLNHGDAVKRLDLVKPIITKFLKNHTDA